MDASLFKQRVAQLRKAKGLSQKELADSLGVAQNTVSQWERGEREPYLSTIINLAAFFGVSIESLVEEPPDSKHPERKIGKKR